MTKVGKLFVFVQFVLSIGALVAATVSFSFHMRGRAPKENYFQPEIKKQTEIIARLAEARDRAEARWMDSNTQVRMAESFRPQAQAWYDAKLKLIKDGTDNTGQPVANPVQALEYSQPEANNLESRGLAFTNLVGPTAIEHRGVKLTSYVAVQNSIRARGKLIEQQQEAIKQALIKYDELGTQLRGAQGVKGLYLERELMEASRKRAVEERESLKPALANRYSEAVLVLKRQGALLTRKQELEKVGVAAGNRP
jgi:hypothetical protein